MKPLDWTPASAGETNLRHRPLSSFRRKPESSGTKEEFDVYTIMALLVRVMSRIKEEEVLIEVNAVSAILIH
jgi:hypothetical protein